jgi:hypothetical protein
LQELSDKHEEALSQKTLAIQHGAALEKECQLLERKARGLEEALATEALRNTRRIEDNVNAATLETKLALSVSALLSFLESFFPSVVLSYSRNTLF